MSTPVSPHLRRNIISFALAWTGLVIFIAIVSLFSIWSMNRAYNDSAQYALTIATINEQLSSAQVDFKIQIQEWKNILLRGKEDNQKQNYLTAFTKQEKLVQIDIDAAAKGCISIQLNINCKELVSIGVQHQQLGVFYKEVLSKGSLEDYDAIHQLDLSVRGRDRELEEKLNKISNTLSDLQISERNNIQISLNQRYNLLRKFILIVTSFALVITIISLYRLLRSTRI